MIPQIKRHLRVRVAIYVHSKKKTIHNIQSRLPILQSQVFGTTGTLDGEMGPYPVGDANLLGPTSRVFGTTGTLDGEMGPYPVGDSTNLLGTQYFSTGYGTDALTIGSGRYNYGTTGPTVVSTTCSPMPKRRTPGVGRRAPLGAGSSGGGGDRHETSGGCSNGSSGIAPRDSFRRHSAHGRIVSSGI